MRFSPRPRIWRLPTASCLVVLAAAPACAEDTSPVSAAVPPTAIELQVDASDIERRFVRVRESLPVQPGPLTLYYPQWIPGTHSPSSKAQRLAGLQLSADGQRLAWRRDAADVHAFRIEVPAGSTRIEASFQFLAPAEHTRATQLTKRFARLEWQEFLLYPAGTPVREQRVAARLRVPAGWQAASALRPATGAGGGAGSESGPEHIDERSYDTVSLETLVDSPVFAGANVRHIDLDTDSAQPVRLHVFADQASALDASTEAVAAHRRLVQQADRLFGQRPYTHYDFLLGLGEGLGYDGLEHHASSENLFKARYFSEWPRNSLGFDLLPHEYVHTWNGKFRRPQGLLTPDFNHAADTSLLWVYEGLTQYWGLVLAARSGLIDLPAMQEDWAGMAAWATARRGRSWRPLQDTTVSEVLVQQTGDWPEWGSWQRSADYYDEGALIWLEADVLIRERSGGRRSLDDFARAFFGTASGAVTPRPYDFDQVVAALNGIEPLDWGAWLRTRLDRVGDTPPLDGLTASGWRLAWSDKPGERTRQADADEEQTDQAHSLGLVLGKDGKLMRVVWDSPAFRAGLAPGPQLVAVNMRAYKPEALTAALVAAKEPGTAPIELLLKDGDDYRIARIDYRDGPRYPKLERIASRPDWLQPILAPR